MIETVTKRDLNQQTAQVLARVVGNNELIVTERGQPRWRVMPYEAHMDTLTGIARLHANGQLLPPSPITPWPPQPGGPAYTDMQVDALVDEMKGDW